VRLAASHDVSLPRARLWAALTDLDHLEALVREHRVELARAAAGGAGTEWEARFRLRGADRRLGVRLVAEEAPERLGFGLEGEGILGTGEVALAALGPGRTRLAVSLEIRPRTFAARLVLASLGLAQGRVERRFARGVAGFARLLAARGRRRAD